MDLESSLTENEQSWTNIYDGHNNRYLFDKNDKKWNIFIDIYISARLFTLLSVLIEVNSSIFVHTFYDNSYLYRTISMQTNGDFFLYPSQKYVDQILRI